MAKQPSHFDARRLAFGAVLTVLPLCAPLPVAAQQVITDNSSIYSNNPSVYVDLGVLDKLGQPASLQSLLSGRQALEASGYPQLTEPGQKLKLKAPAQPKPKLAAKPKPLATILAEPPKPSSIGVEPTPVTAAPQTAVETAPAAAVPPAPPAPPKIAEASPAAPAAPTLPASQPTPIVKAPEPPKAPALPAPAVPAPPAIETAKPLPPSAPEIKRPQETASLPDAAAPSIMEGGETLMQIVFAEGATRIPDSKVPDLKSLAARMAKEEEIRLQLLAYADGTDANASKARRLSLSRALAVRSYLIDQGVRSTRIDVRALGNKAGSGPSERVDVVMLKK